MGKYTYEIKQKAVEDYLHNRKSRQEICREIGCDKGQLRIWIGIYEKHGKEALRPQIHKYSRNFKLKVIKKIQEGQFSLKEICILYNISDPSTLRGWLRNYEKNGLEDPIAMPKRKPKVATEKTEEKDYDSMTEKELREELLYLRAENEFLKKLRALVQEQDHKKRNLSKN